MSLVAVLGTLLFAGGVGSVLSQRWRTAQLSRRVMLAGLWIAALAVIYRFALSALLDAVLEQPLAVRFLVVMTLTALLGVPMGVPFPSLMRLGRAGSGSGLLCYGPSTACFPCWDRSWRLSFR